MDMLEDWERRCCPTDKFDQRSLRPALYRSEVRFTPLPNRYNCQYHWKNVVDGPVKIFHGPLVDRAAKSIDLQEAISKLNRSHEVRLHYRWGGALFGRSKAAILDKDLNMDSFNGTPARNARATCEGREKAVSKTTYLLKFAS
jgi:hypothetical protein